ncbi:hypothetical protein GCM10023081_39470 [Arthrobacter ginkgonis]|uniref:Uncharacterized protein n=1 Tax=Arthrobacter ginkgonis TaxID=1630594 RepID=A0ABP7CZA3_9MICC
MVPFAADTGAFAAFGLEDRGVTESFSGSAYLPEVLQDLKIIWVESGPVEKLLEREVLGIRNTFRKLK